MSWCKMLIYGINRAARKEGNKRTLDIRCKQLVPGGLGESH